MDFSHGLPGLPQFATSKKGSYPVYIMILGINHNLGNPSFSKNGREFLSDRLAILAGMSNAEDHCGNQTWP
jgi:hypothetical protein